MKQILLGLLLIPSSAFSAELTPYIEWKNVQAYKDSNKAGHINHLRMGTKFGNFYAEAGGARTDSNKDGFSGEAGYKWKLNQSFTLKGKWEGVDLNDTFGHKLETELRYTF